MFFTFFLSCSSPLYPDFAFPAKILSCNFSQQGLTAILGLQSFPGGVVGAGGTCAVKIDAVDLQEFQQSQQSFSAA